MEMWNKKLDRENISDFYYETIEMVYPSVYGICKETTRTEQAIIQTYVDVFQQRQNIPAEEVIYVFGDILLKNANEVVERYELPEGLVSTERALDEYTRNSMLEKIINKIDSRGFKVQEFISSDPKKKSGKGIKGILFSSAVTPLLLFHMIVLALIIWGVSYVAIEIPYRNNQLVSEDDVYGTVPLQEKYVSVLGYLPLNSEFDAIASAGEPQQTETTESPAETEAIKPSFNETEPSATRG